MIIKINCTPYSILGFHKYCDEYLRSKGITACQNMDSSLVHEIKDDKRITRRVYTVVANGEKYVFVSQDTVLPAMVNGPAGKITNLKEKEKCISM